MSDMKAFVCKFQCPGCIHGSDTNCGNYAKSDSNESCSNHVPSTWSNFGKFMLGMPKGFNRLGTLPGENARTFFEIYSTTEGQFDKFNVPVWKIRYEGAVLVRGLRPRISIPFIHLYPELSEEEYNSIDCLELTEKDLEGMD